MEHKTENLTFNQRIFALDFLRAISIAAVVYYHSMFFPISTYSQVAIAELTLSAPLRFCVPLLLTLSFILFEHKLQKTETVLGLTKKRLNRILIPTIFWFFLAALLQRIKGNSFSKISQEIITGNIFIGAYFLIVLLQLTILYILLRPLLIKKSWLYGGMILQVVAFISIQYILNNNHHPILANVTQTLITIDRPLILYWFIYMLFGFWCYHNWQTIINFSQSIHGLLKISWLALLGILMIIEFNQLIINDFYFTPFEYVMNSCLLSPLILLTVFVTVRPNYLNIYWQKIIMLLSKYSLGIFCINGIISQSFSLLIRNLIINIDTLSFSLLELLVIKAISWIILLAASLGLSIFLDKCKLSSCVR